MSKNVTVVMYHYVRELADSRYPEIKGLELEKFANQIEYLKKHYNVISMDEAIHATNTGYELPPKAALLTFDDGYVDHYLNVLPILSYHDIKGCFYVPAKAVQEHAALDVNKLHFILAAIKDKSVIIKNIQSLLQVYTNTYNLQPFEYYYNKLAIASRYDNQDVIFIKRLLQAELPEELRYKIVDQLFIKFVGVEEKTFAKELYMNRSQLTYMIKNGMHIGCHGFNHYWWNKLTADEMTREIDLSLSFLKSIGTDMNNWTACYPYGSFDQQAVKILRDRGCQMAFTTQVGIANFQNNDRLLLPRLDTNDLPQTAPFTTNEWFEKA